MALNFLYLFNGNFYALANSKQKYNAVLIQDDKIIAVGEKNDLNPFIESNMQKIDLEGLTATAGLVDGHTHFFSYAQTQAGINLDGILSIEEALNVIAQRKDFGTYGSWVMGGGWDPNFWEKGWPDKSNLDQVINDQPACFFSKDYHSLWVNSVALQKAQISQTTEDVVGGEIQRDQQGNPTGILKENAMELVLKHVPEPTVDEVYQILKLGMAQAVKLGLTGVHNFEAAKVTAALQKLHAKQELQLRFLVGIARPLLEAAIALGLSSGYGNNWLRFGSVKLFLDGALGSQTAAMLEPYENEKDYCGIPTMTATEYEALVKKAVENNLSVAVHAIGDWANKIALDGLFKVNKLSQQKGLRHRIEHAQLLTENDIQRLSQLQIIPSMQPCHLKADYELITRHWGWERGARAFACRSLLDEGANLVLGSDAPVESIDPLEGIYHAVFRATKAQQQQISIIEAIRAYTTGPAYAANEETFKGDIAKGKLADLTFYDHDFINDTSLLSKTKVKGTMVGGKFAFQEF